MNLIVDTVLSNLPYKRRQTPSGWIGFNAVCCTDKRQRGGIIVDGEAVSYHCFNCGFKCSWQPGRPIGMKMRKLLNLLNLDNDIITKLQIEALRHLDKELPKRESLIPKFLAKSMPRGSEPISNFLDNPPDNLIPVLEYIYNRNLTLEDYEFYWTPEEGFDNRLIIPFYYRKERVGYTARTVDGREPKYLSEQQPGYVFNLDNQSSTRKFIIVCEGPLDAISIGAVSVLGSEISKAQSLLINQLHSNVVVVPDRDSAGKKLISSAIEHNYKVSLPDWPDGVKDINDAIAKLGRLDTLLLIKENILESEVKIKLHAKNWLKEKDHVIVDT